MWDKDWLIQFPKVSFAPNDKLFSMGEPIRYNYYLIDGICAKVLPSADGKDAILAYCEKGRMVGVHIKRQKAGSPFDFIAKTDCHCYKIPCEYIEQQIRTNNELCYQLLQEASDDCDFWATYYVTHFFGGSIAVLCLTLKSLAHENSDGSFSIPPLFSNVELGKLCGIHTVSVSRLIGKLTREGILERKKEGIVIYDMERLSAYVKLGE